MMGYNFGMMVDRKPWRRRKFPLVGYQLDRVRIGPNPTLFGTLWLTRNFAEHDGAVHHFHRKHWNVHRILERRKHVLG